MTKKRLANVIEAWKNLGKSTRFVIITILSALVLFGIIAKNEDWSRWIGKEKNYNALEDVAYEMIENKNFQQPLSDSLSWYEISVKSDGTIDLKLYSSKGVEYLSIELSKDYQIQSFQRHSLTILFVMTTLIFFIIMGIVVSAILHIICFFVKKIYIFIKN